MPYTLSYVTRKLVQQDNLYELPKDKRPNDRQIWDDTSEDLEQWLDEVISGKIQKDIEFDIDDIG
jgi:hypothetical protein